MFPVCRETLSAACSGDIRTFERRGRVSGLGLGGGLRGWPWRIDVGRELKGGGGDGGGRYVMWENCERMSMDVVGISCRPSIASMV